MKRDLLSVLQGWRGRDRRKPLLIRGARQVGKTHLVRQFGREFPGFVEANLEARPDVAALFERDFDPKRIIRDLKALLNVPIHPGRTLLFFDEAQQAPKVLTAMRYFYEEMPELHVIAAGSLLDFAIEKVGIPVGRVESLYLYPMSFREFIAALGEEIPAQPVSEAVHDKFLRLVGEYLTVGGMPEAVHSWTQLNDPIETARVHATLLEAYRQDFHKYANKYQIKYIDRLFQLIPKQMGKKFNYREVGGDYRRRELAPCLDLLATAGVIHRVTHTAGTGIPLGAEARWEHFKLLFLDIGLAQSLLGLDLSEWLTDPHRAFANRGELVEAFVGQEFIAYTAPEQRAQLFYWQREQRGSHAEVDYLLTVKGEVIPVEVKSGKGGRLQSLHLFLEERNASYGIRISPHNFCEYDHVHSYPLYAISMLRASS